MMGYKTNEPKKRITDHTVERIEEAQMINKGGKRGIVLSDLRKIVSCILKGIVVVSAAIGVSLSALTVRRWTST